MLRIRPFDLDDWRSHDWELSIFPEYTERNDVLLAYATTGAIDNGRRRGEQLEGPLPEVIRAAMPIWNVTFWEIMDVDGGGRSNNSWIIARLRYPQDVLPFKQWLPESIASKLDQPFMRERREEFIYCLQQAETKRAYLLSLERRLAASTG